MICYKLCSRDFLYGKVIKSLASLSREKEEFESKMEMLYGLLHDLFLLKVDPSSEFITNVDIREKLQDLSIAFSIEQIVAGTKTLDHLETGARRNLNKHLALDQFVFQLSGHGQLAEGETLVGEKGGEVSAFWID